MYSIRTKLIVCFLTFSVLQISLFGLYSYRNYVSAMNQTIEEYTEEVIGRVDRNLETYISDVANILDLSNDENVQFFLNADDEDNQDSNQYRLDLWNIFNKFIQIKTDLVDIQIINSNGETLGAKGVYYTDLNQNAFLQAMSKEALETIRIRSPYIDDLNRNVISIVKRIGTLSGNDGYMLVNIDVELLNRICNDIKLGEHGYVYLTDHEGRVIYLPVNSNNLRYTKEIIQTPLLYSTDSGHFKETIRGRDYMVTHSTFQATGWKLVGVSWESEMTERIQNVREIQMILITVSVAVALLLGVYFTVILSNPIRNLRTLMLQATKNDFSVRAHISTKDEIGQLAKSFNHLQLQIKDLMEHLKENQRKMRRLEMKALQELIKPHFVYNTLDSIIFLLEQKRNDDALDLVESLGKFFRISLSHGKEVIPLREEFAHIRNYCDIQKFRFNNRFDYTLELEPDCYAIQTLKLLLQPLVENAIQHGIRPLTSKGHIWIRGYVEGGGQTIILQVQDTGVGIPKDRLGEIQWALANQELVQHEDEFFGLRNVNERIQLYYGKEYGLELNSEEQQGTIATIRLAVEASH